MPGIPECLLCLLARVIKGTNNQENYHMFPNAVTNDSYNNGFANNII